MVMCSVVSGSPGRERDVASLSSVSRSSSSDGDGAQKQVTKWTECLADAMAGRMALWKSEWPVPTHSDRGTLVVMSESMALAS